MAITLTGIARHTFMPLRCERQKKQNLPSRIDDALTHVRAIAARVEAWGAAASRPEQAVYRVPGSEGMSQRAPR
jgi:hypothetical protein